ncbi:MAG: TerB family tellurite resistance protein [Cyclobacteriaceae bacterium]|nr:TerB family tellurite resistance protein [Cyclobacteriaceae bacterium]
MKNSEREVKLAHFKNLVAVAMVDGYLDDDEREFLEEQAEEFGLPNEEVTKIINNADQLEFIIPESEVDKEEQLADIVFITMIDGEIEEKEYELCLNIAKRLELKKNDLDEVIALTQRLWKRS